MKLRLQLIPDDGTTVYQKVLEPVDPQDPGLEYDLPQAVADLDRQYQRDKEKRG